MARNLINIIILAIMVISCNFKEGDFSVKAPKGWIQTETVSNNGKYVKMRPPLTDSIPKFIENINVSIVHSRNLDSYILAVINEVKKDAKFYVKDGEGVFNSGQEEGKWIMHTISSKESKETFQQKVYFIKDGRNVYMIVCSAKNNGIGKIQSEIDAVINSFKIL